MISRIKKLISIPENRVGFLYGSSSIIGALVSMITGIIIIGWIDPSELGIWQSISVIQLYLPILEIGIPSGLNRELPFQYGKGKNEKGISLAATSQKFMKGISFFLLMSTVIVSINFLYLNYDYKITAAIFVVGIMASLNAYNRHLTVTYRSNEAFTDLAKINLIDSLVKVILFPTVYFLNYYGLLIYTGVVLLINVLVKHLRRPVKVESKFDKQNFTELFKTGMPVFVMNYIRGITYSFNRIILLLSGGTLFVGLFTPVMAIGNMINLLPGILGNYYFPKMNITLGKTDNPSALWPLVIKLNLFMIIISLPFIVIVWTTIPYIIATFFEKYTLAIQAIQLYAFNMVFAGTLISHNAIYAVKAYKNGYIFTISEFCIRFFLPLLFVYFFSENILTSLVYGTILSSMILFFLNLVLIKKSLFN